jgi:murein DD-endopeptidase MepM/ murein hydrolase activator NlpD
MRISIIFPLMLLGGCISAPFHSTTPAPLVHATGAPNPSDRHQHTAVAATSVSAPNVPPATTGHNNHSAYLPTTPAVTAITNTCHIGGVWRWPAQGQAQRKLSQSGNYSLHIYAHSSLPVFASASGKVIYSGVEPGSGRHAENLVIIEHNPLYRSVYAHNRHIRVRENDYVMAGQHIADMGTDSYKRHILRFEIRCLDKALDPLLYLPYLL